MYWDDFDRASLAPTKLAYQKSSTSLFCSFLEIWYDFITCFLFVCFAAFLATVQVTFSCLLDWNAHAHQHCMREVFHHWVPGSDCRVLWICLSDAFFPISTHVYPSSCTIPTPRGDLLGFFSDLIIFLAFCGFDWFSFLHEQSGLGVLALKR